MSNSMNVLQHNLSSMFTNRQLGITTGIKAKSSEKLSSGYRINRAADDAAGLSISEKLRRQIRGLRQGSTNICEGINLIKTAEGALNEVHDMLQRMNELTIKGVNGTLSHEDRSYIQYEIDNLYDEIARTASSTTYNEIPLLMGNPLVSHEATEEELIVTMDIETSTGKMPSAYVSFGDADTMPLGGAAGLGKGQKNGTAYRALDGEGRVIVDPDKLGETEKIESKDQWSPELEDNYGSFLDFSNLASLSGREKNSDGSDGVSNLYKALSEFIGTGFYATCATCPEMYSIVFTANQYDYCFRADDGIMGATSYVDITDLLVKAEKEPDNAGGITEELLRRIEKGAENSGFDEHYTRFEKGEGKDNRYKLYIYDIRDYTDQEYLTDDGGNFITDKYGNKIVNDSYGYINQSPDLGKSLSVFGNIEGSLIIKNVEASVQNVSYLSKEPLNIQHGDDAPNNSKIHLPDLMGIFDIYKDYGYDSVKQSLTLEEEIPAKTLETGATWTPEVKTTPARTVQRDVVEWKLSYLNGEPKTYPKYKGKKTVEIPETTETVWTYHKGTMVKEPPHYGDINFPMIDVIKNLLQQVSEMRTDLGAQQNRLEHAYNYNENANENMSRAESLIRDTDMSDEMVRFSNVSILQQAGQSMLAQANQSSQGILTLLR